MILCEKCNNFYFPEMDEDENFSMGCSSPSVIDVFGNFTRRYKCKYYRKITYKKMFRETIMSLYRLTGHNLRYRSKSKFPKGRNNHMIAQQEDYFEYRDYLFQIEK